MRVVRVAGVVDDQAVVDDRAVVGTVAAATDAPAAGADAARKAGQKPRSS